MSTTTTAKPPPPQPDRPLRGSGAHRAFEASLAFFLAPLRPFLADPDVTEIMVNGHDRIYIEKNGLL
jgi:hypothetical protein